MKKDKNYESLVLACQEGRISLSGFILAQKDLKEGYKRYLREKNLNLSEESAKSFLDDYENNMMQQQNLIL